jgi:hypothetical protein
VLERERERESSRQLLSYALQNVETLRFIERCFCLLSHCFSQELLSDATLVYAALVGSRKSGIWDFVAMLCVGDYRVGIVSDVSEEE